MAKKAAVKSIDLQPLGEHILVEREDSATVTAGGIVLPDSAKEKPSRGVVLAVGNGKLLKDGSRSTFQVKPGDRVLFTSYAGIDVKGYDRDLLIMFESDVLAVIE